VAAWLHIKFQHKTGAIQLKLIRGCKEYFLILRDKNQKIRYLSLLTNPGCVKHLISWEMKKT
jgi:hypothetical protein